jgi:hypothetical protein
MFDYSFCFVVNMEKDYKVIAAYSIVDLEKEVGLLLADGWNFVGGVSARTGDHGEGIYYQAMYRGPITTFYI